MIKHLPVEYLQRGHFQPRRDFLPDALQELADSIKEHGIIEPIIVRSVGKEGRYEIIAGERRWRAAQLAQLYKVPCLIEEYTDKQAAAITLIENIQRADLNPIEEAQAFQNLINVFGYTHETIAKQVGKPRTKISNSLRLLKLDERVQQLIRQGQLSEGHGKVMAGMAAHLQHALAMECVKKGWSVRQLEQIAKKDQPSTLPDKVKNPNYAVLERALSDHIGCKVNLVINENDAGKGQLVIDFHSLDILEGVFDKLKFKLK